MRNYKILSITKLILSSFWYLQILFIAVIIFIGFFLLFDVDFIDLNYLNGFNIHFSKIDFSDQLICKGGNYDFALTNGEGRLHIYDLNQKFVLFRMFASLVDSFIYLMIIYFLRKIFENLTDSKYFIAINGMYIKKIALSIILLAIVPEVIHYFVDKCIIGAIHIEDIVLKNEFSFDYQTILLGLLVFVISIIFLRGIELREDQKLTI